MLDRLQPLGSPLIVTAGAFAVLIADMIWGRRRSIHGALQLIAFVSVAAAFIVSIGGMKSGADEVRFSGAIRADGLAEVLSLVCLLATAVTVTLSAATVERLAIKQAEYYALLLLAAAGMVFLVRSEDLITLFLSIELMSIAVYALCGIVRRDGRGAEAAMKYFVCGAFASAFLLYGSALIFGAAGGTIELAKIPAAVTQPGLAGVGLLLFLVGFLFKIGAVPFHQWVPDAYEGAATPVTAFMSVGVKVAAFGALIRVFVESNSEALREIAWVDVFWCVALVTMIAGNALAVAQSSVKRMLAYSGVAHTGYAMVGLVVAARQPSGQAVAATVVYLLAYAFMTLGAFAVMIYAGRGGRDAETYEDYAGYASRRPWAALAMSIFMLSLAGLPPTAGFFGKFMLFRAAVAEGEIALAVAGVLASVVSLYYYLRVMVFMYMKTGPEAAEEAPDTGAAAAVALAAVFTLLIGLAPEAAYGDVVVEALRSIR